MELLRWDVWGAMPRPDAPLQADQLAYFDSLVALTQAPDASFEGCVRSTRATAACGYPQLFLTRISALTVHGEPLECVECLLRYAGAH